MSRVVFAFAVATTIGLGGCGSHSESAKERYEHRFQATMKRLQRRIQGSASAVGSKSTPLQAQAAEKMRVASLKTADELAQIAPPDEVVRAHRLFVAGLRAEMRGRMRRAIAALARGNKKKAGALLTHATAARDLRPLLMMKEARDIFRAKGYRLASTGGFLP
jgi:ribosomal protein L44E